MNTGWGVAVTGVMIFNGISGEGEDPFFPLDSSLEIEKVDACLAHPQVSGLFHYHLPTPCVPDPDI